MAQAPDPGGGGRGGGAGAPRLNRTIKQFSGMNTREFRNAVPEGAFPWLENIQPIGPGNLHSIPGRGQAVTLIPPLPPPPPGCTDATVRGQQHLVNELRFVNPDDHGGNTHTSWSYISPTEELYTLAGDANCGGGNMTYSDLCCQINHFDAAGSPTDHPALVSPDGFPAVNAIVGVSDTPLYSFANSTYRRIFFPATNTALDLEALTPPGPPFGNFNGFTKRGNNFYGLQCTQGGGDSTPRRLWAWELPSGNALYESLVIIDYFHLSGCCTDNFIYVLVSAATGSPTPLIGIAKIARSDGSLDSIIDVDNIDARAIYAVNDNLIYIISAHSLYYLENFTDLIYVGSTSLDVSPFSCNLFFTNGRVYYGSNGFSGSNPNIFSFPVPCPEGDAIIASVTTDAAGSPPSIAAGADLTVNWADVLEPTIGDQLYLNPNDGVRFHTSPLAQHAPGTGAGSGSFAFTIPALTTPGSYVIQYVWSNTSLVATSAPFTVT